MFKTIEKEKGYWINLLLLIIIAIFLPFTIESLYLLLNPEQYGGSYTIFQTMPYISDDVWYFNQVKSMIVYGHPLGYYGYDGSHALIGNFGAHGWFILLPDYFFCKFFGLNYNSGTVVNIILFSVLIFVFGYFFDCSKIKVIFFAVILFAPFTIYFLDGWLMEGIISFWGSICAILLSRYGESKNNSFVKWGLIAVVILASLSKVTWCVLVPPCLYVLFTNVYSAKAVKFKNALLTLGITAVFSIMAFIFYIIFSAPYFEGSYGTYVIFDQIKNNGFIGIVNIITETVDKIISTFVKNESVFYNLNAIYILVVLLFSVIWGIIYRGSKYSFIPLFVMVADILGVISLYVGGIGAIKTITPAATFALVYMYSQSDFKFSLGIGAMCFLFLLGSFIYQVHYGESYTQIYNEEKESELKYLERYMSQIDIDSNTDNPWDNTVAFELMEGNPGDNALMLMPAGTGLMMYQKFPSASDMYEKYIILTEYNSYKLGEFQSEGYSILCEFDGNIILNK